MADSKIEWTNNTWNPTTGCTKISKECDNCYAEVMTKRMMSMPNQPRYKLGFNVFAMHEDALNEPYKWTSPKTVFVNSMSDLFHKDVKLDFLQRVFKVMNDTPQHTYQVLTKRHHELLEFSADLSWSDNIWMGVSVGSVIATRRIENLVKCGAKHKFLSIEPLIEELPELDLTGIDWVIVGGESGTGDIRPMELGSAYDIVKDKKPRQIKKVEPKRLEIKPRISESMSECEIALENGEIDAIIVFKDLTSIKLFSQKQLERLMFYKK